MFNSSNDRNSNYNKPKKDFGPRRNEFIRVPEIQLINDEGENIGVISTDKAREMAKEVGLDLVEVGANVKPPVCKIMDFSKYLYMQNKKKKSNKNGKVKELKEFRFTPVIDIGDTNHRIARAHEFLAKGHPVRITMVRKGRQTNEQAQKVLDEILTNFVDYSSIEAGPKYEGKRISITYKSNGTTKNKQNSKKETQAIQPKGEQEGKANIQAEPTGTLEDKEI